MARMGIYAHLDAYLDVFARSHRVGQYARRARELERITGWKMDCRVDEPWELAAEMEIDDAGIELPEFVVADCVQRWRVWTKESELLRK